jgi:2,4-dienoyl-CoA reductase-like NADH-dependent reductase (Old Yellow Enzyme family)
MHGRGSQELLTRSSAANYHPLTHMSSLLFEPVRLGNLELENRIVIAPMCQYSAHDGAATDWHLIHLGHLALSGAGLLIIEASAVEAQGRISAADLGLYSDECEDALAGVLASVRRHASIPIAIQLAHAGRKASTRKPWDGGGQVPPGVVDGWHPEAPSSLPFSSSDMPPLALDRSGLKRVRDAFAAAARRAARIGLDGIEVHSAHGYLLHEFLSPLANTRDDEYGGSLENRLRFPLEVFDAVRAAFPAEKPVWVRVSASDWAKNGWSIDDTVAYARMLKQHGAAAIHVSSGGLTPQQVIPMGPGYQVPFARRIRQDTGLLTMAVGLITEPEQAEDIIRNGEADMVSLARGILYDPRWPWHAAAKLGARIRAPKQYWRSAPVTQKDLFANG